MNAPNETSSALPRRDAAARAFAKLEPALTAMDASEIRALNVDPLTAVSVALGAIPRLRRFEEEIAGLPGYEGGEIERLEVAAYAFYFAHVSALPRPEAESERAALLEEARPLRASLLVAAEALADRALLSAERIARIRSGQGNMDLAGDLTALAALFAESWHRVESKTAVEVSEVERAGELGELLLLELTQEREQREWPNLRARAFTHLHHAYEVCRRAAAFIRHFEGDADEIAPSLFTRGPRARKPATDEPEGSAEAPAPAETAA